MKHSNKFRNALTFFLFTIILVVSCQKDVTKGQNSQEEISTAANQSHGHLQQTKTFSSEVARKWHDLQLRILRIAGANPYGLQDLVGSVWQLTNDVYMSGSHRYIMMKGGSYFKPSSSCWYVQGRPRELHYRQFLLRVSQGFERNATVGFRCMKDLD